MSVDDLILLRKAREKMTYVMEVLNKICVISRQQINNGKRNMFSKNTTEHTRRKPL